MWWPKMRPWLGLSPLHLRRAERFRAAPPARGVTAHCLYQRNAWRGRYMTDRRLMGCWGAGLEASPVPGLAGHEGNRTVAAAPARATLLAAQRPVRSQRPM